MCQYFRVIKAPGEEAPSSYKISLNSTEQLNKNYTKYLSSPLLSDTPHGDIQSTHVPRSLEIRVGTSDTA